MKQILFPVFLCFFFTVGSGCSEKAEEKIVSRHANQEKRKSVWMYSDASIKKVNDWYSNGIKETEIPYKNDVPHGKYIRWSVRGSIANTGTFKKGKKEGKWISWFENKKKESFGHYLHDEKDGLWQGFHYQGKKAFEEFYKKGVPIGIWKYWNKNGTLIKETSCFETSKEGFTIEYSLSGKKEYEQQCRYGKPHGLKKRYYPGGALKSMEHFENGTLNGKVIDYLATGKVIRESQWEQGVREGLWKWFDYSGEIIIQNSLFTSGTGISYGYSLFPHHFTLIAESSFTENKLHGKLRIYPLNSKLNLEEEWEEGELKISRSFFKDSLGKNGTLANEGFWKGEKKEGAWRNWYSTGILKDSLNYKNGEPFGGQFHYDSTGKLYLHKEQAGKTGPTFIHLPKNF